MIADSHPMGFLLFSTCTRNWNSSMGGEHNELRCQRFP